MRRARRLLFNDAPVVKANGIVDENVRSLSGRCTRGLVTYLPEKLKNQELLKQTSV